jgi:cyclohexa-1,5-dienecarbonyl-CoA hydratase
MPVTTHVDEGIGRLVLDDPPLNILTRAVMAELRERLAALALRNDLRALIVSARGRHFSAGASVEEHLPGVVETMIPEFMETVSALHRFPAPVVVAVQGRCLGGALELALAGDLVLAGESAVLGVPEIQLGVFPPAACVQLPRRVGPALAAELVFTGASLDARAALEAGLVRGVVPDDRLEAEARTLAGSIARHSAATLRAAKRALRAASETPGGSFTAAMDEVARIYLDELMETADAPEGLRSFVEKRQPRWSHS